AAQTTTEGIATTHAATTSAKEKQATEAAAINAQAEVLASTAAAPSEHDERVELANAVEEARFETANENELVPATELVELPLERIASATANETAPAALGAELASPIDAESSLRARLEEQGVAFTASLWFDAHTIARGGLERGSLANSYLDLSATFDLGALAGWENALVFANAYATNGRNASDLAGDWQVLSNTANDRHVEQLAQLFYEQTFAGGAWRLKLGKADATVDFAAASHRVEFVQSSAGFSPTIFALPTYPEPSTGGAVFWQASESLSLGVGVYDGAANSGFHTGSRGPSTLLTKSAELFAIGEAAASWSVGADELAGRVAFGTWHHDGDFARFDGGNESGTGGQYALLEQELARFGRASLASFAQWGSADDAVAEVDQHLAAGVVATGCFEREDDAFGVYVSRVRFSDELGTSASSETACECFYRWQAQPWLALKPDLQWIANPGGDASLDDVPVFTLRLHAEF
ncbi:MAG: carbohydrate porin, partial [Planctomycetota bacterium]